MTFRIVWTIFISFHSFWKSHKKSHFTTLRLDSSFYVKLTLFTKFNQFDEFLSQIDFVFRNFNSFDEISIFSAKNRKSTKKWDFDFDDESSLMILLRIFKSSMTALFLSWFVLQMKTCTTRFEEAVLLLLPFYSLCQQCYY